MCNTTTGRREIIREMLRQAATAFCNLQVTEFLKVSKFFFQLFAKFSRLTPGISMPLYNLIYGVYRKP